MLDETADWVIASATMTKRQTIPTPSPPRLLTPGEAAHRLNVSPRTLSRWSDEGYVPVVVLPSGHRRFRVEDIDALAHPAPPAEAAS